MSRLRPLHVTLAELADGALASMAATRVRTLSLRATSIEMSLSLDIRIPTDDGDVLGDLPLFRRRTVFDPEPARLTFTFEEIRP